MAEDCIIWKQLKLAFIERSNTLPDPYKVLIFVGPESCGNMEQHLLHDCISSFFLQRLALREYQQRGLLTCSNTLNEA